MGGASVGKRSGFIRTSGTFSWADTSTSCILNRMCRLNGAAGQGVLPTATQFPIERNALYDEAYSEGLGLRQRIGVSTLGVIGGLLVLLVVAAVACEDAEPNATVEPTLPGTLVSRLRT